MKLIFRFFLLFFVLCAPLRALPSQHFPNSLQQTQILQSSWCIDSVWIQLGFGAGFFWLGPGNGHGNLTVHNASDGRLVQVFPHPFYEISFNGVAIASNGDLIVATDDGLDSGQIQLMRFSPSYAAGPVWSSSFTTISADWFFNGIILTPNYVLMVQKNQNGEDGGWSVNLGAFDIVTGVNENWSQIQISNTAEMPTVMVDYQTGGIALVQDSDDCSCGLIFVIDRRMKKLSQMAVRIAPGVSQILDGFGLEVPEQANGPAMVQGASTLYAFQLNDTAATLLWQRPFLMRNSFYQQTVVSRDAGFVVLSTYNADNTITFSVLSSFTGAQSGANNVTVFRTAYLYPRAATLEGNIIGLLLLNETVSHNVATYYWQAYNLNLNSGSPLNVPYASFSTSGNWISRDDTGTVIAVNLNNTKTCGWVMPPPSPMASWRVCQTSDCARNSSCENFHQRSAECVDNTKVVCQPNGQSAVLTVFAADGTCRLPIAETVMVKGTCLSTAGGAFVELLGC